MANLKHLLATPVAILGLIAGLSVGASGCFCSCAGQPEGDHDAMPGDGAYIAVLWSGSGTTVAELDDGRVTIEYDGTDGRAWAVTYDRIGSWSDTW